MSYTITNKCIGCQRCLSACPTRAIQTNGGVFWIDIHRCNQCAGSHGVPQCWSVCPTNEGCVPLSTGTLAIALATESETSTDYWRSWFATYSHLVARLKDTKPSSYWQQWFDRYSQSLQQLQNQPHNPVSLPVTP
jgi:ferredoxin